MFILEKKAEIKDLFLYPINSSRLSQHPILCTETLTWKLLPGSEQVWMETRQMRQSALGDWYQESGVVPVTLETLRSIISHLLPQFPASSGCPFTEGSGWALLLGDFVREGLISEWEWFLLRLWACTPTLVSSRRQKQRERKTLKSALPSVSETNSLHFCHQLIGKKQQQQHQQSTPVLKCPFFPRAFPSCLSKNNISSPFQSEKSLSIFQVSGPGFQKPAVKGNYTPRWSISSTNHLGTSWTLCD